MIQLTIVQFCEHYGVAPQFIEALVEYGLVEAPVAGQTVQVHDHQWPQVERWLRLHHDLHINIAGLEAVEQVLQRLEQLQQENQQLRSRLRLYETD